jgi:hypothetical protein
VYVPATAVFTVPLFTMEPVRLPEQASVAVAFGSTKVLPAATVIEAAPLSAMEGASVSFTFTERTAEAALPEASATW